tara:strand:- start:14265 stop:15830 length:1566 start_codon:yes stop_codon:yes gene_type:complete
MNNYLKKFLLINKKIIDPKDKEIKVVIADRSRFQDCLINASFGSAFCIEHKANALIISDKKNEVYKNIYESFGYTKFFEGLKVENFFSFIFLKTLLISIIIFFIDLIKIYFKGYEWFIRNYKIESIPLGDLIYNSYVRYDHSYLKKYPDLKFTKILLSVIIKFKIFSHFFKLYKIKYVLAKGGPYASSNGILFRFASCKNIKIIKLEVQSFNYRIGYSVIKKYFKFNFNKSYLLLRNKSFFWKEIEKITLPKLDKFIKKRNFGKIHSNFSNRNDLKKANLKKSFWTKKKIIQDIFKSKDYKKKLILIAPHAFSDAPHGEGTLVFKDYYTHFKETLDYIYEKKLINAFWLVKPHPSRKDYGELGMIEKMMNSYESNYLKLCPKDLSAINSTEICDNVITSTGSISFEFGSEGKYAVVAAQALYSNLGFTIDHSSKKKYFKTLKNIHKIQKLSKNKVIKAKRILYGVETLFENKVLKKSEIFDKKVLNVKTNQDIFSKHFIKNIIKRSFLEDSAIKDFASKKI